MRSFYCTYMILCWILFLVKGCRHHIWRDFMWVVWKKLFKTYITYEIWWHRLFCAFHIWKKVVNRWEQNLLAEDDIIYRLIVLCSGERTIILDSSNVLSLRVLLKQVVGLCNKKKLCENSLVIYSTNGLELYPVSSLCFWLGEKVCSWTCTISNQVNQSLDK